MNRINLIKNLFFLSVNNSFYLNLTFFFKQKDDLQLIHYNNRHEHLLLSLQQKSSFSHQF